MPDDLSDDVDDCTARIRIRCVGCQEPASLPCNPDTDLRFGLGDTLVGKAPDGTVLYRCPKCFDGLWITGGRRTGGDR